MTTYRKSLHSRLRKLERIEDEIDVDQVSKHLRIGEPVQRSNRLMAQKLSAFFEQALESNVVPVPFDSYEDDPPLPPGKSG